MGKSKKPGKRLSLLWLIPVLVTAAFVFLFAVNRFSLVIIPNGDSDMVLEAGEHYEDPGISVLLRGSLVLKQGIQTDAEVRVHNNVDTSRVGIYSCDYLASFLFWDEDYSRTVQIRDSEAPVITLNTVPGKMTIPGEPYEEDGYAAWDVCDGDLTEAVLRQEKAGIVTYQVTDHSGNTTVVTRTISYADIQAPVLTLNGDSTVYLITGNPYEEQGWMAEDDHDGNITEQVAVEGSVDTNAPGHYQLTYHVSDSSGNETTTTRKVVVSDHELIGAGKVIYLTFDDGPTEYTKKLLKILDKYDVKATFFVVRTGYIDLLEEIAAQGHALGIHSVTHNYKKIYASEEAYLEDLYGMQRIIYDQTGIMTYLMRFPGGSSNTVSGSDNGLMTLLTQKVEELGFQYFDWNVNSMDAGGAEDSKEIFDNVRRGIRANDASVVLQHDTMQYSVNAVERIIQWGLENGYTFLPLDMNSPTAHQRVQN